MEDCFFAIKKAGFDEVCFASYDDTKVSWETQARLAQKYSLPVENAHLSGSGMTSVWSDGEEGDLLISRLIKELKEIADLGIKTGVVHVTWGHSVPPSPTEFALRRYQKAVDFAEKIGVNIALENSVFPYHLHFLLDNLKSNRVGLCYDSGHENAFTPEEDFVTRYYDRIIALHIHDNDGVRDLHAPPLKNGTIDWDKKIRALLKTPYYNERITLECGGGNVNTAEEFYSNIYYYGKKMDEYQPK